MIREQRSILASGCFRDDQTKTFMESSVYFLKHFDKGRGGPCLGVKHLYLGITEFYVYIHFKALSIFMYHLCCLVIKEIVSSWRGKYLLRGKSHPEREVPCYGY